MSSVAIIGFSDKTFPYCKTSPADEFWTLNHAGLVKGDELPRIDRLFEIHKEDWYGRKEAPKTPVYLKWLAEEHPFPIYMQNKKVSVPSSVEYPFDAIVEALLSNLVATDGREEVIRKYFTSSFAFMMALAIFEGHTPIYVYGIDMENNTEYGYQKPGGEFWIGIALGRGLKVVLRKECNLCNADLYGYEVVPYMDSARLKDLLESYKQRSLEYHRAMQAVSQARRDDPENEELVNQYLEQSGWFYAYEGAVAAGESLILGADSYIGRQAIDLKRAGYINGIEYWKAQANAHMAQHELLRNRGEYSDEIWRNYLDARANMYNNMGAVQLHQTLMDIIDFRPYRTEIIMEIKEQ